MLITISDITASIAIAKSIMSRINCTKHLGCLWQYSKQLLQVAFNVDRETNNNNHHRTLSHNAEQKILPVSPLIQCEAGRAKAKLFVLLGLKMAAV